MKFFTTSELTLRSFKLSTVNVFLLFIIVLSPQISLGQTIDTLLIQDFEFTPATPTWTYSGTPSAIDSGYSGSSESPANSPKGINGSRAWKVVYVGSGNTLTFSNFSLPTSGYDSFSVVFRLAAMANSGSGGPDNLDYVLVSVSTDGGSNYYDRVRIRGAINNNSSWAYSATGLAEVGHLPMSETTFQPVNSGLQTTLGYSTVKINFPDTTHNISVKINIRSSATDDIWFLDNLVLLGYSKTEYFVDSSITSSGTGSSWSSPFKTFAEALDSAWQHPEITAIHVAKGTYSPTTLPYYMDSYKLGSTIGGSNKDKTFHIRTGLEIYGGYPSGGGSRDPSSNHTILSGLNVGGVSGDSAYHVVLIDSSSNWAASGDTTLLDGLYIENGHTPYSFSFFSLHGNNIVKANGSGVVVAKTTCKISNCTFQHNYSSNDGGGLLVKSSNLVLSGCTFANNHIFGAGAGVFLEQGSFQVASCSFTNNLAENEAAGIYLSAGNLTVDGCQFVSNRALNVGGCIRVYSGASLNVLNSSFSNNHSAAAGASVHGSSGSYLNVQSCTFEGDSCSGGSAVAASSVASLNFHNNYASGNTGSPVYIASSSNVKVYNNVFTHNSGGTLGGGISLVSTGGAIFNNTFFGNSSGETGGAYIENSSATLTNNLFWANKKSGSDTVANADVKTVGTGTHTFKNNGLQLSASHYSISNSGSSALGSSASANHFAEDPYFIDTSDIDGADNIIATSDDGLRLGSSSLLVDAGDSTVIPPFSQLDFAGSDRVQGNNVNPGAYEDTAYFILCSTVLYVDSSMASSGIGTSWSTAFKTLAEALDKAWLCPIVDSVLVAKGTYFPMSLPYNMNGAKTGTVISSSDNRDKTFHIRTGLEVYGGYPNGGGSRDITSYTTILEGLGVGGVSTDSAYHVVLIDSSANWATSGDTTRINGFTIRHGSASVYTAVSVNGNSLYRSTGGGILAYIGTNDFSENSIVENHGGLGGGASLVLSTNLLRENTIKDNTSNIAGGVYTNYGANTFIDNTITGNSALDFCGGIYHYFGRNILMKNLLLNNSAVNNGGGFMNYYGNGTLSENVFEGNTSGQDGGGAVISQGVTILSGNTFVNNTAAGDGGGIWVAGNTNYISNNIFWKNKKGSSSTVQGADYYRNWGTNSFKNNLLQLSSSNYTTSGSGNYDLGTGASGNLFNIDPRFEDTASIAGSDGILRTEDDGLRLTIGSPCINTGDNGLLAPGVTTDIIGGARIQNTTVDMGAYEGGILACPGSVIYVDSSMASSGVGSSWSTAFHSLSEALYFAWQCPDVDSILIAEGTYVPDSLPYNMAASKTGSAISSSDNQDKTFHIRQGLEIYGGYPSGGGTRDISLNTTIFSGANVGGVSGDTSYHVVVMDTSAYWGASGDRSVLDGVTVSHSSLSGSGTFNLNGKSYSRLAGGGVLIGYTNANVRNCTFTLCSANQGAGIYVFDGDAKGEVGIENNKFINNYAPGGGAGFASYAAKTYLSGNLFESNTTNGLGGATYAVFCKTVFVNNLFANNTNTGQEGGAVFLYGDSYTRIINNTFAYNQSVGKGGGLDIQNSQGIIANNIFWGNQYNGSSTTANADFSTVDGANNNYYNNLLQLDSTAYTKTSTGENYLGALQTGNLFNSNPDFKDSTSVNGTDAIFGTIDDGFATKGGSVVADKGDSTYLPDGITTDLSGEDRIQRLNINIGAYEDTTEGVFCSDIYDTLYPTQCISYTSPSGNYIWDTTGVYYDTMSFGTCDSLFTINLTILSPTTDTIYTNACYTYPSPSGKYNWTSSGVYYDTLTNDAGCDSLITVYLDIHTGDTDSTTLTAMDSFTTASGMLITTSGTYIDTAANQYGCDSIITYFITITKKLFVDGSAGSGGNGASWGSPFRTLKEATDAANTTNNTVEIWVKAGTYAPDNNGSTGRTSTFLLTNINTKLYGGFNGSESSRDQRDPANNRTVLSGDIGISGNSSDNCFHVLSIIDTRPVSGGEEPLDTSFVIDGFVISGANANGSSKNLYGSKSIWKNQGGGILIYSDGLNRQMSPLINNCLFENNYADFGSGIYIEVPNGSSDAMISNCIFQNNAADYGTIYNNGNAGDITPMILNCVFDQNSAHTSGAGIYNFGYNGNASPSVLNCVFSQNSAINQGGAIYNNGYAGVCSTYVANSTFFANSAGTAAGMMGNYGKSGTCSPSVVNCVSNSNQANGSTLSNRSEIYNFSASPSFSYCAMQMDSADYSSESFNNLGSGSNNQFGVNPSFSNSANPDGSDGLWMTSDDGLIPNSGSPLINAGTNTETPAKDIRGINRSGNRDIGAYEKP